MYYKEPEISEYTLDRNMEYSAVLKDNDKINMYGKTLLQSDDEDIVTGWNGSVVAKVMDHDIQKLSYSDYGATSDITSRHGYNGEMLDSSGLIYLRARYYVNRFDFLFCFKDKLKDWIILFHVKLHLLLFHL